MCMWVNTFQVQCHLSIMFICNESVGGESVSLLKEGESESPFMFVSAVFGMKIQNLLGPLHHTFP